MSEDKRKPVGVKTCDICGRQWPADEMVYSRVTDTLYCPVPEWQGCVAPQDKKEAA